MAVLTYSFTDGWADCLFFCGIWMVEVDYCFYSVWMVGVDGCVAPTLPNVYTVGSN